MMTKKITKSKKQPAKKKTIITKQNAVQEYLKYKGYSYPSFEDFQVWCINKKIMTIKDTVEGGYRGLLYIYSKRYLTNQISDGARGAGNLIIMLRQLQEEHDKLNSHGVTAEPVKITVDFPKLVKGKHERKRIKTNINNN